MAKGIGDPEALTANGIVDAGTAEMGAVREVSPRVVLEAVPLLHEVVATVVPDLNDLWMGGADFRDMWRVQNDLAAVGDDRLYLVEPLGACPDVVVSGREQRQDPANRRVQVPDVRHGRHVHRFDQVATGSPNAMKWRDPATGPVTAHRARCSPGTIDAASSISARTGVVPRVPMISALVIKAPSQCDKSMNSRPDTPGKRYLLPPEKPTTSWETPDRR